VGWTTETEPAGQSVAFFLSSFSVVPLKDVWLLRCFQAYSPSVSAEVQWSLSSDSVQIQIVTTGLTVIR
jgi:hypothetical protein